MIKMVVLIKLLGSIIVIQCSHSSDVSSVEPSGSRSQLLDAVENTSKVEAQSFRNFVDLRLSAFVVLLVKFSEEVSKLVLIAEHTVVFGDLNDEFTLGIESLEGPYAESNEAGGKMFDFSDSFHCSAQEQKIRTGNYSIVKAILTF